MEYCNANLYSNTPVLQNSILFNPVHPGKKQTHVATYDTIYY
jgi:hypothetical protein